MFEFLRRPEGLKEKDAGLGRALGRALASMPPDGACPPPEDLAALSEDRLARKERDLLFAHLAACERCREAYNLVVAMTPEEGPAARRDYGWQVRRLAPLAAAAGVILAIVSVPLILTRDFKSGVGETVAPYAGRPAADLAAPASPAPAPPEAARPAESERRADTLGGHASEMTLSKGKKAEPPAPAVQAETRPSKPQEAPAMRYEALPAPAPPPPGKTDQREAAGARASGARVPRDVMEAPPGPREAPEAAADLRQAAPEPQAQARQKTAIGSAGPPARYLRKRVEMDLAQRVRLAKADSVTSDKEKMEALLKDLKLDARDFPLADITKIIVLWSKPDRAGMKDEQAAPATVPADVSLGDGGVLTIVVLEENPGGDAPKMKYRDRMPRKVIGVGC